MEASGLDYAELAEWSRGQRDVAAGGLAGEAKRDARHLQDIVAHLDAIIEACKTALIEQCPDDGSTL